MGSSIKVNGLDQIDRVLVYNTGLMEPNTKATGKRIRHVERENSLMPIVTPIKVNGKTTKPMDTVSMHTSKQELDTRDIGKMI